LVFKKLIEMDKKDIISRFIYAQLIDDGTHNKFAESRDLYCRYWTTIPTFLTPQLRATCT
jgi:hypothetical protein